MSRDPRVDAYIAKAQPFARPILEQVRARVHAVVPRVEETLKWNMPAYLADGKILLITAAFKAHAALNFWRGQDRKSSHDSVGTMGQFGKLTSVGDLPDDLDRLIAEAAAMTAGPARPRKLKHAPKPPPEIHPEFATALDANSDAKANFEAFSPSARRDYLEWTSEARQDATRAKRIATAVEWIADGKKRHWKYEKC